MDIITYQTIKDINNGRNNSLSNLFPNLLYQGCIVGIGVYTIAEILK